MRGAPENATWGIPARLRAAGDLPAQRRARARTSCAGTARANDSDRVARRRALTRLSMSHESLLGTDDPLPMSAAESANGSSSNAALTAADHRTA